MATAASLVEAAALSYAQLSIAWAASTLKTKVSAFITAASPLFSDAVVNDRPVGNWLIPMRSLESQMDAGVLPESQFNGAVDLSYRICLAAASADDNSLISSSQATSLLAAWNAQFAT